MTKASDNLFPKLIVQEAANDGSDFSNPSADYRVLFLGEDGQLHVKDSSGTVTSIGAGTTTAYADYTPALTAASVNPTLGSGSVADGRYTQIDDHVEGDAFFQFGASGAAAGTGAYRVSLPVNAKTDALSFVAIGYAYMYDSSSGTLSIGVCSRVSTSTIQIIQHNNANPVGAGSPWTWANDDVIIVHFAYEAA